MKHDDISNALNDLDDKIIEETNEVRQNPKGRTSFFQKHRALAACFVVLLLGSILLSALTNESFRFFNTDKGASEGAPPDNTGGGLVDSESVDLTYGGIPDPLKANAGDSSSLPNTSTPNDTFVSSQMEFALNLFQTSAAESNYENVLVSPTSMMQALAMTANGARGETQAEMLQVLSGGLSMEELNAALYIYRNQSKLQFANSIWIREENSLSVNDEFLNVNETYYDAQVFAEPFDAQTTAGINNWVKENTDGHIEKIVDSIDSDTMMYLINALAFDAEWEDIYLESDIFTGEFHSMNETDSAQTVEMMHSTEYYYIHDENATGFIKDYKDGTYRFAALLPNEDITISSYVKSLTSEGLLQTLENVESTSVNVLLPKFSCEYELEMNSVLQKLGIVSAFDRQKADLSNLGTSENGNLFISKVLHKTFIAVDEKGTKAGAAASVEIKDTGIPTFDKEVYLNRPFVYMILDGNTNLPIFIGTVVDLK